MRPSTAYFPHTVNLSPLTAGGSGGPSFGPPRRDRPAIVDEKVRQVADQRPDSDTAGQTISSTALVMVFLEDYVTPGSDVTMRPGTPYARTAQVVAAAAYDHPDTPEHVELWVE